MATRERLDRLNASERELLLLLGRGHTAKSIAALKGLSERAVNERFRSARRKTGIGSSREIARLLVARENRDDFIGLAEPAAPPEDLPRLDAPPRASRLKRWSLPMSAAALLIASAILAQQTATLPERPLPPAAASMFSSLEPSPDLLALRAEIGRRPADPAWSPTAEVALSRIYRQAVDPIDALASLDVTCNATLCEIIGVSREGLTNAETAALLEALQRRETLDQVRAMKLDNVVQSFHSNAVGETSDAPATIVFAAYWRRTD